MSSIIILIIIILLVIWAIVTNIRIVPQANAYVMERLGAYNKTWQVGLHVKIPFIDRIARKVSLKEHVIDFPPQPVITKDNVTIEIDTVVYFQITDPKLYAYGVENPMAAIENLTATTLRNIIGELELDQTLTSREHINSKIRIVLDEATANVDPENEAELMQAIDALTKEKTIIMIAHRLKTVRNADQILVIDGGKIAQRGTHETLMREDSIYRSFVESRREAASWRL